MPRLHHDEIVNLIASNFAKARYCDPSDPMTHTGPLISERQREKVDGVVQRAVDPCVTLVIGGQRVGPGFFDTPTLLRNIDPNNEVAPDDVFGPDLAAIAFNDEGGAVRIANNSIYCLAGAVFSGDRDRAVAQRIRSGPFAISSGNYFLPDSFFGGFKQSGIGREMRVPGLEEFLEPETFAAMAG